jgi:fatty acid desaturase
MAKVELSSKNRSAKLDWPTLAVVMVIYGGWLAATSWHASIPALFLVPIGGWLLAWHGSLQHETIHGHPTGNRRFDGAIGFAPLSLWLPYALYRRSHLAHHGSPAITDPRADPESRYVDHRGGGAWLIARIQSTLLGHMLVGPPISVARFLLGEINRARTAPARVARDWLPHLVAVALIIAWLDHVGLSLGHYILFFIYPGMALTMLRSYAEHRADLRTTGRAATVERGGPLALLFLNNNLHAAHHERPKLAWYRLPAYHRQHRARLLRDGVTFYDSYGEIAARFALRAHDSALHPHYQGDMA